MLRTLTSTFRITEDGQAVSSTAATPTPSNSSRVTTAYRKHALPPGLWASPLNKQGERREKATNTGKPQRYSKIQWLLCQHGRRNISTVLPQAPASEEESKVKHSPCRGAVRLCGCRERLRSINPPEASDLTGTC